MIKDVKNEKLIDNVDDEEHLDHILELEKHDSFGIFRK